MAQRSPALMYTIGIFDEDATDLDPGALRKLSQVSGGKAYFPKSAQQLPGICEEIGRELRNQYMLGYVPAAETFPGKSHTVRVVASVAGYSKLIVRTRAGYSFSTEDSDPKGAPAGERP